MVCVWGIWPFYPPPFICFRPRRLRPRGPAAGVWALNAARDRQACSRSCRCLAALSMALTRAECFPLTRPTSGLDSTQAVPDPGESQPRDTPFRGRLETHDQYNQASRGAGQWEQVSGMDLDAGTGKAARASFKASTPAAEATGPAVLREGGSSGRPAGSSARAAHQEPPEADLWVPLTTSTRHWKVPDIPQVSQRPSQAPQSQPEPGTRKTQKGTRAAGTGQGRGRVHRGRAGARPPGPLTGVLGQAEGHCADSPSCSRARLTTASPLRASVPAPVLRAPRLPPAPLSSNIVIISRRRGARHGAPSAKPGSVSRGASGPDGHTAGTQETFLS